MRFASRCPQRSTTLRRAAGTVTAIGLAFAGLSATAAPATAAPPDAAAPVDEATASATARATGVRTEVTTKRSETETLYANPDGSWTLEQTTEATRVRRGGAWVAIDPTLVRRADGTVAPVATTLDMTFSGGGTAPLARVTKDGRSLALSFPAPLPAPSLEGARATYADVLPGVDLVVTALPGGFSEVLVVKTRAAALNPALRKVTFAAQADGVTLRPDAGGGFSALDASGTAVFTSPEASMWDSRGGVAPARVTAPREGDKVATMRTEVTPVSVSVVPDAGLLADPAAAYPLYLDPSVLNASHSNWTMVDESFPSTEYWRFTGDQGVGYQNFSGVSKKRQFHQFATSTLAGKNVLDATFKAYETHSASCTATEVELWETGGISSATNWSNQPAWTKYLTSRTVAYGRDGCSPLGAWVEFDATVGARDAANTSAAVLTLGMRAGSETNNLYWKRFRYDAQLSVTYNTDPSVPTGLRIVTPATTCATGTARKWINDTTPTLAGVVSDPDGGNVYAEFEYGQIGGTRTITRTAAKASGSEFQFTIPSGAGFSGNPTHAYSWRIRGYDGTDTGTYSGLCEFYLDTVLPASAPAVSSTAFPEDGLSTYGVGQSGGSFTFAPGAGDTDVEYFKYSFNTDSLASTVNPATLNASATVAYTPTQAGVNYVKVRSYDRANNPGPIYTYVFKVGGLTRNASFQLNEGVGLTTADSVNATRTATLSASGATWGDGRNYDATFNPGDRALVLDGATGSIASTPSGVIDTSKPFSIGISVWLDKDADDAGVYKVLSQNSVNTSAFQLGYENKNWFFRMARTDVAVASWSRVDVPGAGSQTRQWVHLTAVYNGSTIALTVNGETGTRVTTGHSGAFASSGSFIMGAGRSSNYWPGRIDQVNAFPGVLDDSDIYVLAHEQ